MGAQRFSRVSAALLFLVISVAAQNDPAKGAPALSPTARLAAAKTAYLKNAGGSEIPFNVISEGIEGWGRFQVVGTPEKADIIIEVTAPETGNGISVSSGTSTDPRSGLPAESTTSTHELQVARINLIVYDARSKMALWSATEQPKGGLRHRSRQDKVVEASQKLVSKFRERVEPDPAK
jgi:hypothetical protein